MPSDQHERGADSADKRDGVHEVARVRQILSDLGYPHAGVCWDAQHGGVVIQQAGGRRPERNVPANIIEQAVAAAKITPSDQGGPS